MGQLIDSIQDFERVPAENRTGHRTFYYPDGGLMFEGENENGQRVDKWVYRSEDGTYTETVPDSVDGVMDSSGQYSPVKTRTFHTYIKVVISPVQHIFTYCPVEAVNDVRVKVQDLEPLHFKLQLKFVGGANHYCINWAISNIFRDTVTFPKYVILFGKLDTSLNIIV